MPPPDRLLESDATPFERQLLESAGIERPSPELVARMERGLGFSGAGLSGGSAQGAPELPLELGASVKAKVAAWLLGAAGVAAGGVYLMVALPADAPRETPGQPALAAPSAAAARSAAVLDTTPGAAAALDGSLLREEIELVDAIRAARQAGRLERAHELCARHAQRFAEGALKHEVEALRRSIEQAQGVLRAVPSATEAASPR